MTLQETIKKDMVSAMKEKNSVKTTALKSLLAAFTNELVAPGRENRDGLSDEEVTAVIKKGVKQRKDSIEQFTQAGRPELAESEIAEMTILESYLPAAMSEDQVREIAIKVKNDLGITDKSKLGVLIGAVVKATGGQADGAVVKNVVQALFD